MTTEESTPIVVECPQCPFSRTVREGDDESPADVVREHGAKTGHAARVSRRSE
ncbi:hypothetical protein [Halobacterium sp. R2-5]|uniref:hypothetical protein n=1 Tax=Halobacterium sp. R2-5 TaxID=2715751 RepID=UPI00141E2E49|nr:hypothetical protein [Halobacterium sp. R2-5]NIB98133.1 hypothetical protein [Halobacterium sp. R2-5]